MPAATRSRTKGMTRGRYRLTSGTKISSTPCGTPNCRRRASRIFGATDANNSVARARTYKIRFGKRCSLNVRFAPKATELLRRHETTRWATSEHGQTQQGVAGMVAMTIGNFTPHRRLFFDEVSDNRPLDRLTSRVDFELARRRGFLICLSRPIGLVCRLAV
jgi:hypothetical protein